LKNLVIWFAICIIQIPLEIWKQASEQERDKVRYTATMDYLSNPTFKGKKFRIWEVIKDGNWQLHISEEKTEV